ncbi:carboxypeptidase-like regulatory domain-containing protein [candidate division KSB1 bacterium]|nr:carboxypeptidase-like regulatory domain-containing protein [candidate division KSB1 bacterium]
MKKYAQIILSTIFPILVAFSVSFGQTGQVNVKYTMLTGRVTDAATGEPLVGASVYLANSTKGAASDVDGFYAILKVPPGNHTVIVSYIGYETGTKTVLAGSEDYYEIDFRLRQSILELEEITVTAQAEIDWKKHLRTFTREFLGTSENAKETEIVNPEVLDFTVDDNRDIFTATARDIIQIENNALAYTIYFLLKEFVIQNGQTRYKGIHIFIPYDAQNADELKKWDKNRKKAYDGSINHFLASLVAGTIEEEGFSLLSIPRLPDETYPPISSVDPGTLIYSNDISYNKEIRFDDILQVVYIDEPVEKEYNFTIPVDQQEYLMLSGNRTLNHHYQTSWIKLTDMKASFSTAGYLYNPYDIINYGYWSWKRTADLLPIEYIQDMQDIIKFYADPLEKRAEVRYTPTPIEELGNSADVDYFDSGMELKNDGDFAGALKMWHDGKNTLERDDKTDPGLGIAYIELAAELNDRALYDIATEMYMWGFSGSSIVEHKEAVSAEVERIMPLLEEDVHKEWDKLLKENDPLLLTKIRGFWFQKDLTPATKMNERLMEHWERIAYARKNYTRSKRSPYGTDDRGTIFVRYGKPGNIDSGVLGDGNEYNLRFLDILDGNMNIYRRNDLRGIPVPSGQIQKRHLNPEYEIWIYYEHYKENKAIFVFGKPADGRFRLYDSVEELIPRDHSLMRNDLIVGDKPLSPLTLAQLAYYSQLYVVDEFFAMRYDELISDWSSGIPNPGIARAFSQRFLYQDREAPAKRFAPKEKTEYEIFPIIIEPYQFRFLDDDNNPILSVIAMSHPDRDYYEKVDEAFRPFLKQAEYKPIHTLIKRDKAWNEVDRYTRTDLDSVHHVSVYIVDDFDPEIKLTIASEASVGVPVKNFQDSVWQVPFLGKVDLDFLPPLSENRTQLEMSDLITGIKTPDLIDPDTYLYTVLPSREIRKDQYIEVYLEVYHLRKEAADRTRYEINFQLESQKTEGILSQIFRRQERQRISITSSFDSESNTAKEHFAFDISELEPAEYEFTITITDILSGQEITRTGTFKKVD